MEITKDATVVTSDGKEAGHVDRVVLNPKNKEVTHVVITKGTLFTEDKVVPIDRIASGDEHRLVLRADNGILENLPAFEEERYVIVNEEELGRSAPATHIYPPSLYAYSPYLAEYRAAPLAAEAQPPYVIETEQHIPDNTVALKEGAHVTTMDGKHVGNVERVLTDLEANRATHLIISKGLLLKEKKLVPTMWVDNVTEDEVHLVIGTRTLNELPNYRE